MFTSLRVHFGSCPTSFSVPPGYTQPSLDLLCTNPITQHRKYHRYRLSFHHNSFSYDTNILFVQRNLSIDSGFFSGILLRILSLEDNVKVNPISIIVLTVSMVKHLSAHNTLKDMLNF